jgi:hypothetical protein
VFVFFECGVNDTAGGLCYMITTLFTELPAATALIGFSTTSAKVEQNYSQDIHNPVHNSKPTEKTQKPLKMAIF